MKKSLFAVALAAMMVIPAGLSLSAEAYNHGYERAKRINEQKHQQMLDQKFNDRLKSGYGPGGINHERDAAFNQARHMHRRDWRHNGHHHH